LSEKEVKIRLESNIYDKLSEYANSKNLSIRQAVEEIITQFFSSNIKDAEYGKPILIVTKFKSKCIKCGREVGVGESALWVKGLGVICLDCSIPHDKSVLNKYLKIKELERIKKYLSEEVDKLYRQFSEIQLIFKYSEIAHDVEQKLIRLLNTINTSLTNSDMITLRNEIETLLSELDSIKSKLSQIDLVVHSLKVVRKKKKEVLVK